MTASVLPLATNTIASTNKAMTPRFSPTEVVDLQLQSRHIAHAPRPMDLLAQMTGCSAGQGARHPVASGSSV
jgi:hypothetical protein